MRARNAGFSLTELMIIIGVGLLLAALALPVINQQVEASRTAACVAQLRHLSVVMTLFRGERNQRLWDLRAVDEGGEGGIPPATVLYRYGMIEEARELCCPSATTAAKGAWKTGGTGSPAYLATVATRYVSYGVNGIAFYQSTPWKMTANVSHYTFFAGSEARVPLFMDAIVFQLNATSWQPSMRMTRLALRHRERCNVLFLDGHVESLDLAGTTRLDPYGGKNPAWAKDFGVNE